MRSAPGFTRCFLYFATPVTWKEGTWNEAVLQCESIDEEECLLTLVIAIHVESKCFQMLDFLEE